MPDGPESPENTMPPEKPGGFVETGSMDAVDGLRPIPAQEPGANRIDDIDKAHTMALAEDEFRTKAAQNRQILKKSPELVAKMGQLSEVTDRLNDSEQPPKRKERHRLEEKKQSLKKEVTTVRLDDEQRQRDEDRETKEQFFTDFPEERRPRGYSQASDRAAFYDMQASRIGDWAGILHEQPLSEEFLNGYPGLELTPEDLVYMEDEAARIEGELSELERRKRGAGVALEVRGMFESHRPAIIRPGNETITEINDLLEKVDPKKTAEWQAIRSRITGAAVDADAFFKDLVETAEAKPLRTQLALTRNLLNDVRREVGLEELGPGSQEQPEDQTPAGDQT